MFEKINVSAFGSEPILWALTNKNDCYVVNINKIFSDISICSFQQSSKNIVNSVLFLILLYRILQNITNAPFNNEIHEILKSF